MSSLIPAKLYEQIIENIPIVCVDIVIRNKDNGKVLLIKRKDEPAKDQWWVVGGRLYKHELPAVCAIRKIKEEVGLANSSFPKFLGVETTSFSTGYHNIPVSSVNLIHLIEVDGKSKVKIDSTCSDYKWIETKHPMKRLHPYVSYCLCLSDCFKIN